MKNEMSYITILYTAILDPLAILAVLKNDLKHITK